MHHFRHHVQRSYHGNQTGPNLRRRGNVIIQPHVSIREDHLLTEALCNVRGVRAVNRITQARYNWMNLIGQVIFHVCDIYRIKERYGFKVMTLWAT